MNRIFPDYKTNIRQSVVLCRNISTELHTRHKRNSQMGDAACGLLRRKKKTSETGFEGKQPQFDVAGMQEKKAQSVTF